MRERKWETMVTGKPEKAFKRYRTSEMFRESELIRHSTFGDGFVLRVIDKSKVEVMFREGPKTLAQGLGLAS